MGSPKPNRGLTRGLRKQIIVGTGGCPKRTQRLTQGMQNGIAEDARRRSGTKSPRVHAGGSKTNRLGLTQGVRNEIAEGSRGGSETKSKDHAREPKRTRRGLTGFENKSARAHAGGLKRNRQGLTLGGRNQIEGSGRGIPRSPPSHPKGTPEEPRSAQDRPRRGPRASHNHHRSALRGPLGVQKVSRGGFGSLGALFWSLQG